MHGFNLRGALAGFAYAALLGLAAGQALGQDGGTLVIGTTGGDYERNMREHVLEPFSKETGIKVITVSGGIGERWAKVKAMSDLGRLEWDMMEADTGDVWVPDLNSMMYDLGESCEKVPKAKSDGVGDTCNRFGIVPVYGATLLTTNDAMFTDSPAPSSWSEFFDTKAFPGPRSLPDFSSPWRVLIGALLADGVAADSLFPLDLDRAFKKLDAIRPHVALWWKTGDQIQRAIRDEEVASTLTWNTRIEFLRKEGIPLRRIWQGSTLNVAHWVVFKKAPSSQNALRFLNWYFDHPEIQVAFARSIAAAPTSKSALALLPANEQKESPTYPDNLSGVVTVDYKWLGQNQRDIAERWKSWIAQ